MSWHIQTTLSTASVSARLKKVEIKWQRVYVLPISWHQRDLLYNQRICDSAVFACNSPAAAGAVFACNSPAAAGQKINCDFENPKSHSPCQHTSCQNPAA
eukprot:1918570-Karenia_brevis.AAC.1